ncbi:MAG: membrane dipeptidase [Thermomicrobiales bacterium]
MANLVGIDHVGIGSDIMSTAGAGGLWWNANTKRRYPEVCGAMDEHMHGVSGFEDWSEYPQVTEGLLKRGFSESDVRQIIGGNFLRVFARSWDKPPPLRARRTRMDCQHQIERAMPVDRSGVIRLDAQSKEQIKRAAAIQMSRRLASLQV